MKKENNVIKKKESKGQNPIASFLWINKRQRAKNIYFLLTIFVVIMAVGIGYVSSKLDIINYDDKKETSVSGDANKIYEEEEFEIMQAIDSASSYNDFIYKWANNGGELRKSKNVINVLLLGLDSEDALEKGGRSDTILLASLNKKTKKIYLTSFFRDTWTYMNIGGEDRYNKINSAYFYGGDEALIDTFEKNYKIDVDYYCAVDFSSFTDIINALGGITVEVQQYEAEYINRTTVHTIDYGPAVKLNGWEALVFARIRKSDSDSDVSRTRRQRLVISAFIESAKGASLSQLNNALDKLFKYVKTDLTKMQILGYAAQALSGGWMDYEIEQVNLSDPEIFCTGYVGNSAVVFVDFPMVAEKVQKAIYGDSNVVNTEDRVKPFSLLRARSDGQMLLA
ncbi:MAG: LCP family protein [Oscillospiraceae bacterium]|nr:LCP family protein [Oscillospiraceae bacterium]